MMHVLGVALAKFMSLAAPYVINVEARKLIGKVFFLFTKQQVFPWSCHVLFLHGVSCKSRSVTSQDYLRIDIHRNKRNKNATYEGTTATQSM